MRIQVELNRRFVKGAVLVLVILVLVTSAVFFGTKALADKNPLPSDVKQEVSFPVIYPKNASSIVNQDSISYQSSEKALSFAVNNSGTNIVLTEQPASGDTSNPNLAYYQSLGLHPVTEIQTKLGLAVLVNFYDTGDFNSEGQNAVLANNGTLLIAHPAKNISPETWKTFFNGLHIYSK